VIDAAGLGKTLILAVAPAYKYVPGSSVDIQFKSGVDLQVARVKMNALGKCYRDHKIVL
jgi:hypothetical protein